jgi:hypothetical protein
MHNEPKILFNPTNEPIEFRAGGTIYIFQPGEHRPVDGFAAHIALEMTNTGLIPYVEGTESEPLKSAEEAELDKLSWSQLRLKAAQLGVYKPGEPGMDRKNVTKLILEHESNK